MRSSDKNQALFDSWIGVPVGTPVVVTKDDGSEFVTKTRSYPWMLCSTPVILVEGITGGYALERVRLK